VARFAGDDDDRLSVRPIEIDMESFARIALLQGGMQQFAEDELEARGIQPSMWAALFHRDGDSVTLGFGSEVAPNGTCDGPNRHVLSGNGREQGGHIAQPIGDQLLE